MELERGIITIDGVEIGAGYTFADFRNSHFYSGQDGVRQIILDGIKEVDGHSYNVSLLFREERLYILSLVSVDEEIGSENEPDRKLLHDAILREYGINGEKKFPWGRVVSVYDGKSNISSVDLIFD